jgi:putative membrane protein
MFMKRGTWTILLFAFTSFTMVSCEKDDDEDDDDGAVYNATDAKFVSLASLSSYAEIAEGRAASENAGDTAVASFGEMMVTDHTASGQQLKGIASGIGLQTSDSLDVAHRMLLDSLSAMTGMAFDSVYINSQIRDHIQAISLFEDEATNGKHEQLKSFATRMLPHLNDHLTRAQTLASGLHQ